MDQIQFRVIGIKREIKDTVTIYLEPQGGKIVDYQAGQFLTFVFKKERKQIRRSYSFSSAPGIDKSLAVTVKSVPNGEISRFLVSHLRQNDLLNSISPSGRFTIKTDGRLSRQFFFVVAGSGITPVFSLLKKNLAEEPLTQNILISQNHDEKSIIFKKQLDQLRKKHPDQFIWISLLTQPIKRPHGGHRLTNFLLEKLIKSHTKTNKQSLFYLCGPPAMMRMAQFTIKLMGFSDESIRRENFTVEYVPPPPLIADTGAKEIIIHFQGQVHRINASYPTNILEAALNNNITLPYSCRGGRCSTCAAKLLKGKAKMSINEVLTENEIQDGWILTCVGYAETDLELEF